MAQENGNGVRAAGKLALQMLGPAILAALGGYVGVSVRVVRLEERIEGVRSEMRLRDQYMSDHFTTLRATDKALATRVEALKR